MMLRLSFSDGAYYIYVTVASNGSMHRKKNSRGAVGRSSGKKGAERSHEGKDGVKRGARMIGK
jgi:hypothetical protein